MQIGYDIVSNFASIYGEVFSSVMFVALFVSDVVSSDYTVPAIWRWWLSEKCN